MAVDMIARMMAMGNGGGSVDAYTKAQTDALLDGKADLENGKVPASQLPSYVDDVLEYASVSAFPATGESGKIYVATGTNKTYRWGGSAYVEISESLALGETAGTAYPGNKGKANADAISAIKDGQNIDSFGDVETALSGKANLTDLAAVATSGDYDDLNGKPTLGSVASHNVASSIGDTTDIPTAAQVNTALSTINRALTEKTELVDITSQINMETDFTLDSRSRLYKQGNHIFGNLIIYRESDNIPTGQIVCCTLPYPPTISYTGGAFISSDSYDVTALGYVFIMSSYSTAGQLTIRSSTSGAGNYIFIQLDYVC